MHRRPTCIYLHLCILMNSNIHLDQSAHFQKTCISCSTFEWKITTRTVVNFNRVNLRGFAHLNINQKTFEMNSLRNVTEGDKSKTTAVLLNIDEWQKIVIKLLKPLTPGIVDDKWTERIKWHFNGINISSEINLSCASTNVMSCLIHLNT